MAWRCCSVSTKKKDGGMGGRRAHRGTRRCCKDLSWHLVTKNRNYDILFITPAPPLGDARTHKIWSVWEQVVFFVDLKIIHFWLCVDSLSGDGSDSSGSFIMQGAEPALGCQMGCAWKRQTKTVHTFIGRIFTVRKLVLGSLAKIENKKTEPK